MTNNGNENVTSETVLSCQQLVKSYQQGPNTVAVLNSIDFELVAGETVAVIGASGSGQIDPIEFARWFRYRELRQGCDLWF